ALHGATVPAYLEPGEVGAVAQSGSASIVMMNFGRGLDFSYVISTGNESIVSTEDLLEYLIEDSSTRAIALFIESLRQPRRFIELARRALEAEKPIVAM